MGRGNRFIDVPWAIGRRTVLARTCPRCGQFKQADEYSRTPRGYLYSYCKVCHRLQAHGIDKAKNDASRKKAGNHRDRWQDTDYIWLWQMKTQGMSHAEIAAKMGRSVSAVTLAVHRSKTRE